MNVPDEQTDKQTHRVFFNSASYFPSSWQSAFSPLTERPPPSSALTAPLRAPPTTREKALPGPIAALCLLSSSSVAGGLRHAMPFRCKHRHRLMPSPPPPTPAGAPSCKQVICHQGKCQFTITASCLTTPHPLPPLRGVNNGGGGGHGGLMAALKERLASRTRGGSRWGGRGRLHARRPGTTPCHLLTF